MIEIELLETDAQIERNIRAAIAVEANRRIQRAAPKALKSFKQLIPALIDAQPEINEIKQEGLPGSLNAQFGLAPGQGFTAAQVITDAVAASVEPEIRPMDANLTGSVAFHIQPLTYNNILSLPVGFGSTGIHWLDWLLLKGASTVVYGYNYQPGTGGVSGGGTMEEGGSWRVPPEFAGTSGNNFITRALKSGQSQFETILKDILA